MSIDLIVYRCDNDRCRKRFVGTPWVAQTGMLEHFCTIECRERELNGAVEQASEGPPSPGKAE